MHYLRISINGTNKQDIESKLIDFLKKTNPIINSSTALKL